MPLTGPIAKSTLSIISQSVTTSLPTQLQKKMGQQLVRTSPRIPPHHHHHTFIPDDIILTILSFLDHHFIIRCMMLVSQQWKQCCSEMHFSISQTMLQNDRDRLGNMLETMLKVTSLELRVESSNGTVGKVVQSQMMANLTCLTVDGMKQLTRKGMRHLATSVNGVNLKRLSLFCGSRSFTLVTSSVCLCNLTHLTLMDRTITDETRVCDEEVTIGEGMKNLTYLKTNVVGRRGFKAICECEFLRNLRELIFLNDVLVDEDFVMMAQSRNLGQLNHFEIKSVIGLEGAKAFAESCVLTNLQSFRMDERVKWEHMNIITSSPNMSKITSLNLDSLVDEDVNALKLGPYFQQLKKLDLSSNKLSISDRSILELTSNNSIRNLTHLDLYMNSIGNEGVKLIATCENMRNLAVLNLRFNRLDGEALKYIAESEVMSNLVDLDVGHNRIEMGVKYLLGSPLLSKLTSLNLRCSFISDEMLEASSFQFLTNLTYLDMTRNSIGDHSVKIISECPSLSKLTTLRLSNTLIGNSSVPILSKSKHLIHLKHLDLDDTKSRKKRKDK